MNALAAEWVQIDIRYPGESASKDDAREAVHAAQRVQQFVRPKL
jgi:hypothetical protein